MKRSDNTPSHISLLPARPGAQSSSDQRETSIPVLTISRSFLIWRRVKIISTIVLSIAALTAIILSLWHLKATSDTDKTVARALEIESSATHEKIQTSSSILAGLVDKYPSSEKARAARSWVLFVQANLFGPESKLADKAIENLAGFEGDESAVGLASRAALHLARGNFDKVSEVVSSAMVEHQDEPRLELVRIWLLVVQGKDSEASEKVTAAISKWPTYSPIAIEGIRIAIRTGDNVTLKKLAKRLDNSGESHLWSSLAKLSSRLPEWRKKPKGKKQRAALLKMALKLSPKIEASPPKQRQLGRVLEGRVYIGCNKLDEAVATLGKGMDQNPNPQTLEWLALATMKKQGCEQTFKLLDGHQEMESPGIWDVAGSCSLELHWLDRAAGLVEKLGFTKIHKRRIENLQWGILVREGKTDAALSNMPKTIHREQMWLALDLYDQLKERGRRKDVVTLSNTFDDSLQKCGKSMRAWHSNWNSKTLSKLDIDGNDPCLASLTSKWLWGRLDPDKLNRAANLAASASGSGPMIEIQKAKAAWLLDGKEKATGILEEVWNLKPEGVPIKCELARTYLDMGLPNKALDILDNIDDPEALALRFQSAILLKRKGAEMIVRTASKIHSSNPHPATTYILAKSLYSEKKYEEVVATIEPMLRGAGHWTSELAVLAAKAIGYLGNRKEADRLLRDAERYVRTTAGLDELFELKVARADLNLRRGGKYLQKATDVLVGMKNANVPDSRMLLALSKTHLIKGNLSGAGKLLRQALKINPSMKQIYSQIKTNEEQLNSSTTQTLERMWPGWTP